MKNMDANEIEVVENEDARKGVIVAYQEIMNKLKLVKGGSDDNADSIQDDDAGDAGTETDGVTIAAENMAHQDSHVQEEIIELASRETIDELAKNLTELRLFLGKTLDGIKIKLTAEYEKFYTLRQAIQFSKEELANLYDIKVNVNTLSILLMAQKEKEAAFEKELAARKLAFENEKNQMEKERFREQSEYMQKRDASRKRDQEQYEFEKRNLYQDLYDKRRELEENFESREASLAARELEHNQLKEREARILAREQEFAQLKEKETRYPEELRAAVAKAETTVTDQLTRKYDYEIKLLQIEMESDKKLTQQKLVALQQQIEQYKSLKDIFNG